MGHGPLRRGAQPGSDGRPGGRCSEPRHRFPHYPREPARGLPRAAAARSQPQVLARGRGQPQSHPRPSHGSPGLAEAAPRHAQGWPRGTQRPGTGAGVGRARSSSLEPAPSQGSPVGHPVLCPGAPCPQKQLLRELRACGSTRAALRLPPPHSSVARAAWRPLPCSWGGGAAILSGCPPGGSWGRAGAQLRQGAGEKGIKNPSPVESRGQPEQMPLLHREVTPGHGPS